jgi:hypothetical protein
MQLFYDLNRKQDCLFRFIGGKSNFDSCSKVLRCEPSQNGLQQTAHNDKDPKLFFLLDHTPYH